MAGCTIWCARVAYFVEEPYAEIAEKLAHGRDWISVSPNTGGKALLNVGQISSVIEMKRCTCGPSESCSECPGNSGNKNVRWKQKTRS